ncbi:MAG: dihydropteroate synthase [Hydrogenophilales bacterium CG_4_9_14_3_um_filter_59_35]|nr:MAG: dihydropteroate synthase [Hydrogenophilales bacterium CG18_big_fil_WC_8_21_14_2_50_58_12]PJB04869.1 MAG: dihydropteroate synthase [Hydrogenophilales bacterium CG_4_9_14_3_um_filter_59_35]
MFVCGRFTLPLNRPLIMGIVNVTPDSFSDGGRHASTAAGIAHAFRLLEEGADILDIGGESSRPGAQSVGIDEELRRVLPIIEALQGGNVPVSVDTCKTEVMRAAISAGAAMVNDINALQGDGALEAVAGSNVAVCLMHKQGAPQTMQLAPRYNDVVAEVMAFLAARIAAAQAAGIGRERLVVDPGFGFGKSLEHNVTLLRQLDRFQALGVPLLAGLSRKSMLGQITGLDVDVRLIPSVAAAVIAAMKGARIIRVHDVKASKEALQIVNAIKENHD